MKWNIRPIRASVSVIALAASVPLMSLAAPVSADTAASSDLVTQLESKWSGVMRRIKGWDDSALRQFRDGYRSYPADVLQKALSAQTFEEMTDVLDAYASKQAQVAMAKAYPFASTLPQDADDPQMVAAKQLVAKTLGDDSRDLVFIPVNPCTVWDTRYATNVASAGVIADAQTKRFYSHMDGAGGSYAPYGGAPSCPDTSQNALGVRPYAVMMTAYVSDATGNGWLTFYRDGDPDPSTASISVYYSPGPTRTQTVISKSSRGYGTGTYDIAVTGRYASANAAASVVGYFMKATGGVGAAGPTGPTGATGPQGPTGATGAAGAQGIQGPMGPAGPMGATGAQGPTGAPGATGAAGLDGRTILSGTTAPSASLGNDGDIYIDTASNVYYGPKSAGAWGSGVSIIGPAGAAGAMGSTGPQGAAGAMGPTGAQGPQGAIGPTGAQGPQGAIGPTGAQGPAGATGTTGATGAQGPMGLQGATGAQGPAGATGPQGSAGPTGAQGPQGAQGPTGSAGPAGPQGADGTMGAYGDGSAGALNVGAGTTLDLTNPAALSNPNLQFTNITVGTGGTLIVPSGTILQATGTVTVNGTITVAAGAQDAGGVRAHPGVSLSPAGAPQGGIGMSKLSAAMLRHNVVGGGAGARNPLVSNSGGGGYLSIYAKGNVTVASGGVIQANGQNAFNPQLAGQGIIGGGGGGGGVVKIASKGTITVSGTIAANGGNGSDGWDGNGGNSEGGGGGGGGGIVHLLSTSSPLVTGSIQVNGGAPGANNGAGATVSSGAGGGASGGNGGTGAQTGVAATAGSVGYSITTIAPSPENLI